MPTDVMAKVLDCSLEVSEFELQSIYSVYFRTCEQSIKVKVKLSPFSRGWPEDSLFNNYYTEL